MEVFQYHQYRIRLDGSRQSTLRNRITCLYSDIESFLPVFKNTASNFLILSNNVRSLGNNFTCITNLIDEFKSNGAAPDFFAMQEIWNHPVESLNIDGYNLIAQPKLGV